MMASNQVKSMSTDYASTGSKVVQSIAIDVCFNPVAGWAQTACKQTTKTWIDFQAGKEKQMS
jgi:hypothetical protein